MVFVINSNIMILYLNFKLINYLIIIALRTHIIEIHLLINSTVSYLPK